MTYPNDLIASGEFKFEHANSGTGKVNKQIHGLSKQLQVYEAVSHDAAQL